MTVTANDLVLAVRRKVQDWGSATLELETSLDTAETTVSAVAMPEAVDEDRHFETDLEMMRVVTVGQDIEVERARRGTTAAAHTAGAMMILDPRYTNLSMLVALNLAAKMLAAYEPKITVSGDGDYAIVDGQEEYACPSGAISVLKIETEQATGLYRPFHGARVLDEYDPPVVRIPDGKVTAGKKFRIVYGAYWPALAWDTATTIPEKWHDVLAEYAAGLLLEDEDFFNSGLTQQAAGTTPKPGTSQQLGRNYQGRAMAHLEALRPATRVIYRPDQRSYRD